MLKILSGSIRLKVQGLRCKVDFQGGVFFKVVSKVKEVDGGKSHVESHRHSKSGVEGCTLGGVNGPICVCGPCVVESVGCKYLHSNVLIWCLRFESRGRVSQSILAELGLCTWVCVAAAASCALTLANILWVIVVYESVAARHVCIYLYNCMSMLRRVTCAYTYITV